MKTSYITTAHKVLPAVPLRDMVVFPHMMAPFIVGRESSVRALEVALGAPGKRLFLITQRDPKIDDPTRDDIREIGVVARVIQNLKHELGFQLEPEAFPTRVSSFFDQNLSRSPSV